MNTKLITLLVCITLVVINSGRLYAEEFVLIPMEEQTHTKKKVTPKNQGIQIDTETNEIQKESKLPVEKRTFTAHEIYDLQPDDPTLVNLDPKNFKALETMEKRLYRKSFNDEKTLTRIERLEQKLLRKDPKKNPDNINKRMDALKLASSRRALSGTALPPAMSRNFMQRDLQSMERVNNDGDVGIIDGLVKVWSPDLYQNLNAAGKVHEMSPYYYF